MKMMTMRDSTPSQIKAPSMNTSVFHGRRASSKRTHTQLTNDHIMCVCNFNDIQALLAGNVIDGEWCRPYRRHAIQLTIMGLRVTVPGNRPRVRFV